MKISIQPSVNLVESMRDMGYTLGTALADLVDNSISAGASKINILVPPSTPLKLALIDDGRGMELEDLKRALTLADSPPSAARNSADLGRFGMGMKTASWSQCRRFTVVSSRNGERWGAVIDLDEIRESDEWSASIINSEDLVHVPFASELPSTGTLVLWEKIDRLEQQDQVTTKKLVAERMVEAASHLELVFHRFLVREGQHSSIDIAINGQALEAHDPFFEDHPAAQARPDEYIPVSGGRHVRMQVFTIPHHTKIPKRQLDKMGGPGGFISNQGFYLYRARRLIVWGTWFRMMKAHPRYNLARIRLDITNDMDDEWSINIMKAHAAPPPIVRNRLRTVLHTLGQGSERVYTRRGHIETAPTSRPIWLRKTLESKSTYFINEENPVIASLFDSLEERHHVTLRSLFRFISASLPLEALFADLMAESDRIVPESLTEFEVERNLLLEYQSLVATLSHTDAVAALLSKEPYKTHHVIVEHLLNRNPNV